MSKHDFTNTGKQLDTNLSLVSLALALVSLVSFFRNHSLFIQRVFKYDFPSINYDEMMSGEFDGD